MRDVIPFAKQSKYKMPTKGRYGKGWPEGGIVHYDAGAGSAEDTIAWGKGQGYTFLAIGKDGTLFQAHPASQWGYHAGKSAWARLTGTVSDDVVGCEVACAGILTEKNGKFYPWFAFKNGQLVKPSLEVAEKDRRYSPGVANQIKGWYMKYTAEQESMLINLWCWFKHEAPSIFTFDDVMGHDETRAKAGHPGDKQDPGAALSVTMPEFRRACAIEYDRRVREGFNFDLPKFVRISDILGSNAVNPPEKHDAPASPAPQPVQVPERGGSDSVTSPPERETFPVLTARKLTVRGTAARCGIPMSVVDRLLKFWKPESNPRYYAFFDVSKPSNTARLFVIDAQDGTAEMHLAAHGSGSDRDNDKMAERFGNESGSNMTSLGIYKIAEPYQGKHGYSLRLDGLESTNSNARARAVVMHNADYVSDDRKIAGRSNGCVAVDPKISKALFEKLANGSPLIIYKGV